MEDEVGAVARQPVHGLGDVIGGPIWLPQAIGLHRSIWLHPAGMNLVIGGVDRHRQPADRARRPNRPPARLHASDGRPPGGGTRHGVAPRRRESLSCAGCVSRPAASAPSAPRGPGPSLYTSTLYPEETPGIN